MKKEEIFCNLFGFSKNTYYLWKRKRKERPIIKLIESYFSKEDLEEYLSTGEIEKQEFIKDYSLEELKKMVALRNKVKNLEDLL